MGSFTIDGTGLTRKQKLALAAVAFCKPCCTPHGGGSGSGSGSGGARPIDCCPGLLLPDTVYATMHSVGLNGSFPLNWRDADILSGGSIETSGWYSDWIYQFSCIILGIENRVYSSLIFFPGCFFRWVQVSLGPGQPVPPVGAFAGTGGLFMDLTLLASGCIYTHSCSPFYWEFSVTDGGPLGSGNRWGCGSTDIEPKSDCGGGSPGTTRGAWVELSL